MFFCFASLLIGNGLMLTSPDGRHWGTEAITVAKHWKIFIATVCQYNTSNLSTECIQNQFLFLNDCTSKHMGPIVS